MATFEFAEDGKHFGAGPFAGLDPARHTVPAWRIPAERARGIVILTTEGAEIDWHATMRDCVAEASVLATRIETRDSEAGEALQRLCNVVAHLLDEGEAMRTRVDAQNRLIQRIMSEEPLAGHFNAENGL